MSIDPYSLCPGGTGKKIKFCCPELVGDLEKIDRMLEGDQHAACLTHIDRLLAQRPDRACLLATKGALLRATGELEASSTNAAAFLASHPDNPVAMAESAIVAAFEKGGRAGMEMLQRAIAASEEGLQNRVYEAIGALAQVFLADAQWWPARALLQLQLAAARNDRHVMGMLVELSRSAEVPLMMKEDPLVPGCPQDVLWRPRFIEAFSLLGKGQWQAAADRLAALAAEVPDAPAVWGNLAIVRGWLADVSGCIDALNRFAALDVPLEDAVEAVTTGMLLADDPLGDPLEVLSVTWTVRDVDRLSERLGSDLRAAPVTFDPSALAGDDSPPPKAAYLLLDRPTPPTCENLSLETIPNVLGQALLFGRQTDREARLEVVGVKGIELAALKDLVSGAAGDAIEPEAKQDVVARVSASQELLMHEWRPPRDATRERLEALSMQHRRRALLEEWPRQPLAIFDGRSPREVADQPAYRVKLLAAVLLLQVWNERAMSQFDFNELRAGLGLPTLDPIDPQQTPVGRLPLIRLDRVIAEKLDDEALLKAFRRASAFQVAKAIPKLARAIVERPSLAGRDERLRAYQLLARTAQDLDQALAYVEQGRQAAEAAGESSASWDLMEISFRLARREPNEMMRLINHVQSEHFEEPGVAAALSQMLVQMGLLRPDGTPVRPRSPHEPVGVPADEQGAEPGKLWTPGSDQPGGGGKLWVPE